MVDHTFMAFPVPLQTLWTPWTIIVPFMFPISSLMLEQGPAATGKAANFGRRWTIFGGKTVSAKRTRKSKETILEAAEKRELNHCI